MKVFFMAFFATIFMSAVIYASDEWKADYDSVEETDGDVYVCGNQIDKEKDIWHYYAVDKNGNVLFETDDQISPTDDPDRYICHKVDFVPDVYKYYFDYYIADGKGKPVNDKKYAHINHKIEGMNAYAVQKDEDNHKMGIVDDTGAELLPFEYDLMDKEFVNGYLRITNSNDGNLINGLVDKDFNVVIPAEYKSVFRVNENLFYASKINGDKVDWYKYENGGLEFFKTTNWDVSSDFGWEDGGFIDIMTISNDGENLYFGTADSDLNVICEPKYDDYLYFENGYAVVREGIALSDNTEADNGKYGVVDEKGNEIIKCEYDNIIRPEKGEFVCVKDGKKEIFILNLNTDIKELQCSSWARDSIISGNLYGIIPEEINNRFSENITRGDFCRLAARVYLKTEGDWTIDEYIEKFTKDMKNPFNDTDDKYIVLANYRGIVSGKDNGRFFPDDFITREEAAVMLANMAKAMNYHNLSAKKVEFFDSGDFSPWAEESIYKMVSFKGEENIPVMTGTGNGKFSPKAYYSREQAITTMVRIYDIREHIFRNE